MERHLFGRTSTRRRPRARFLRGLFEIRDRTVLPAMVILAVMILAAIVANWLPIPNPKSADLTATLLPPFHSLAHPLGTDPVGRDILSRLIYGGRVSLTVGFASVFIATIVGSAIGAMCGYYGGWFDAVVMRLADVQLSMPSFILALTIISVFGAGEVNVILALTVGGWVRFARVVRSSVLPLKDAEYVQSARALGCSDARILFRHMLPNVVAPIIVLATLGVGANIIAESGLSFLGLGVDPQTPSWGSMLANGRSFLQLAWWVTALPGIAISLTVLSCNIVGDWLRDVLDPMAAEGSGPSAEELQIDAAS